MKTKNHISLDSTDKANVNHLVTAVSLVGGLALPQTAHERLGRILANNFTHDDVLELYSMIAMRDVELREQHKLDGSLGSMKNPEIDRLLAQLVHLGSQLAVIMARQFVIDLSMDQEGAVQEDDTDLLPPKVCH